MHAMLKTTEFPEFIRGINMHYRTPLRLAAFFGLLALLPAQDHIEPPQSAQTCASCHGPNGQESITPSIPKLAGQHQNYLEEQLEHFAAGEQGPRDNPIMSALAADLTDAERKEVSAFYATQPRSFDTTPYRADLTAGERLYRGGDQTKSVMACSSCHQPLASGYAPAAVPALAGQYAEYLIEQLRLYRDGGRSHVMMTPLAQRLSDEQIEAVAYYLQGVQPR